jgi:hypothetical protein
VEFFTRYASSARSTTLVQRSMLRKGHAVQCTETAGIVSLCGRTRMPGDVDDRDQDFALLIFPARCAVCAGLMTARTRTPR